MSETSQPPNAMSPEGIRRLEIIKKFSEGTIIISDDMVIRGEKQERKLFITLKPEDSRYQEYLRRVHESTQFTRNIASRFAGNENVGHKMIGNALDLREIEKKSLDIDAYGERVRKLIEDKQRDFEIRGKNLSQDEAEKLTRDTTDFVDLLTYLDYTFNIGAVETILPEQQTGKL